MLAKTEPDEANEGSDQERDHEDHDLTDDIEEQDCVMGAPNTPIPKAFFAGDVWTWYGNLVPNTSSLLWHTAELTSIGCGAEEARREERLGGGGECTKGRRGG